MVWTRSKLVRPLETDASRRRGVVLVLVLFFIILATSLTILVTASSVRLVRTTRHEHESILLRQLTDSAASWVRVHGGPPGNTSVTLHTEEIYPQGTSGTVEISMDTKAPGVVVINAKMSFPSRTVSRTTKFHKLP